MARQFKDAKGTEWELVVDVDAVEAVRQKLDVDLADITGRTAARPVDDPVQLVAVLWLLCAEQAATRQVTNKDFGRLLVGDPLDDAVMALLEAIADFFPRSKRQVLKKVQDKTRHMLGLGSEMVLKKLDDPALEARLKAAMEEGLNREMEDVLTRFTSATSSPAS